eukprot:tig00000145_g8794.t1
MPTAFSVACAAPAAARLSAIISHETCEHPRAPPPSSLAAAALPAAAPVAAALTPLFAENAVEEFLLSHPDLVDNVSGAFYIVFLSACLIAFFVADAKQQEKNRRGK